MNKPPKGTIDLYNNTYEQIKLYKDQLEELFKSYGGIGLETPNFEIRENLLGKYGDEAETKLVYNLENYGGDLSEKYTLCYDLTIPKIRFIKGNNINKARVYSIGKVYRRDNPSKGRYREFYQADFDIIGEESNSVINEFILLKLANELLIKNNLDDFEILINDTNNLKYMLINQLKITDDKFKSICSSIDKLDKCKYKDIIKELQEKGLENDQIIKLEKFLNEKEPLLNETKDKINNIIDYGYVFGFGNKIKYTASLARGLDYYNGIIYEIKLNNFGSTIISGGRYNGLFDCESLIGISFGITRISDLLEYKSDEWNESYYLTSLDNMEINEKLDYLKKIENCLDKKIMINYELKDKKLIKVINFCITNKIRYLLILAKNELKENKIIKKDLMKNEQSFIYLKI